MKTLKIEIQISDESFDLLMKIKEMGYIEFRDNHSELYKLDALVENNLIENDMDSWHTTFVLTKKGEQMINQNK